MAASCARWHNLGRFRGPRASCAAIIPLERVDGTQRTELSVGVFGASITLTNNREEPGNVMTGRPQTSTATTPSNRVVKTQEVTSPLA